MAIRKGRSAVTDGSSQPPAEAPQPRFAAEAALAICLLRRRRKREEALGAHHFSDPSWDMMLDLFAAQVHGEQVATSSLIVAANVPQSTALRRIRRMIRDGDLVAHGDPHDGRRTFVRLSDDLFDRVGLLLRQWCEPFG